MKKFAFRFSLIGVLVIAAFGCTSKDNCLTCPSNVPTPTPFVIQPTPTAAAVLPTPTPQPAVPTATPVPPAPTATPQPPQPTATPRPPSPTATPVPPTPTPSCTFAVQESPQVFTFQGGNGGFSVSASAGTCTWTAVSNVVWIAVRSGQSGSGNGTVTYFVAGNGGAARTGTISAAGKIVTVLQGAQ